MLLRRSKCSALAGILLALHPRATISFAPPQKSSTAAKRVAAAAATPFYQEDLTFAPPNTVTDGQISEELCTLAASKMKRVMVPVSADVSDSGFVGISFIHFAAANRNKNKKTLPLLLVHGFDSSSLEYRRLGPQLSSLGIDVYCVDLLGWGYTQLENVKSFSAQAKVEALQGFWNVVGGNDEVIVGGASLGGAAVIEFAAQNLYREVTVVEANDDSGSSSSTRSSTDGFVRGTVLIDAQGFVDGIGPMSFLPAPLARAGIKVLQSVPLRNSANQMSYYNPEMYATEDALKVGRLHCLREGWEDGMLSFMQSGGFRPKEKVSKIDVPSLVLWGRQDGILEGKEFAQKFIDTMPDAELQWIEECGHVPHLEQPEMTARLIANFLESDKMRPGKKTTKKSMNGNGVDNIFGNLLSFLN
jgi:pimeloyl-ACP methyl ester carboxylesterase